MKRGTIVKSIVIGLALVGMLAFVGTAQADTITYALTGHGTAVADLNEWGGECDGYEFTTGSSDLIVSWLGFYDAPTPIYEEIEGEMVLVTPGTVGDGLAASHQTSIWKVSDGSTVATTLIEPADSLIGSFRGHNIDEPVTLLPNTAYIIAANYGGEGDRERETNDLAGWGINGITINPDEAGHYGGTDGSMPTGEWTTMISSTFGYIPEPATMSLLVLGGLALLRRRRRA